MRFEEGDWWDYEDKGYCNVGILLQLVKNIAL